MAIYSLAHTLSIQYKEHIVLIEFLDPIVRVEVREK